MCLMIEYSPVIPIPPNICRASRAMVIRAVSHTVAFTAHRYLGWCSAVFVAQHTQAPVQQLTLGDLRDHLGQLLLCKLEACYRPAKLYPLLCIAERCIIAIHSATKCAPGYTVPPSGSSKPSGALQGLLH